jgi:hypothetical protein
MLLQARSLLKGHTYPSPHIPPCGEPQGQGPGSIVADSRDRLETANAEINLCVCALPQAAHRTDFASLFRILSKRKSHSVHLYSNIGIRLF